MTPKVMATDAKCGRGHVRRSRPTQSAAGSIGWRAPGSTAVALDIRRRSKPSCVPASVRCSVGDAQPRPAVEAPAGSPSRPRVSGSPSPTTMARCCGFRMPRPHRKGWSGRAHIWPRRPWARTWPLHGDRTMREPTLHGWRIVDGKHDAHVERLCRPEAWSMELVSAGRPMACDLGLRANSILWPFELGKDGPMGKSAAGAERRPNSRKSRPSPAHPRQRRVRCRLIEDGLLLLVRIEDGAEIVAQAPWRRSPISAHCVEFGGKHAGVRLRGWGEAG